ncbi:hypothetical protein G6F70_008024 [Rhizopus microsporus]|uniref:Dehydrogenase n=2 Tax=Rhizopus TaxID=4842 RepID=A0A367JW18_RHIAZ|nr:hypothetical protein G6F71_008013 [Rhizopus microsporus]RCH94095.1 Dehydrogenase [Rhizopus azygosporus]KAG1195714.1 hypothetical protein G6F70_008024 [Rhizopus microsporus]KAG1207547.1 hypothetical protein G6F69_007956 [Rhizopus microsporus]KAG1228359.1 hypothetical protein G6F67_007872 [Rhizopus microsporus]
MQIKEHVFIVTGGASGLGEQVVRAIIDAGGYVSIFDINQKEFTSLADEYTNHVCYFPGPVDVTSESQVKEALIKTRRHFSKSAIAGTIICSGILNAPHQGYGPDNMLTSYSQFEHIIRVNLLGTYCVAQKVSEILLQNEPMDNDGERGIIITTASIVGLDGMIVGYGTSKAAIAGLTLPLARELAPFGIRVMSIAPGPFDTPMVSHIPIDTNRLTFPKRVGRPSEFAELVLEVIKKPMLNGSVIRLDGGLRASNFT